MNPTIYGIDFGTTNSCLAVMEPGGPRVIEIDDRPIVPSIVCFDRKSGEVVVGQRARNRLMLDPDDTVRSVKRRMGRDETLTAGGRELRPEEVAAEVLRYLKEQGEKALGARVERAVVTVPAYFEDAQRRATIRAGELAGLEVVRILNEPTAAALVYDRLELRGGGGEEISSHVSAGPSERILVYDLGGGTFDVSVVEIAGEMNEVLASCGDNHLGGDDFDQLLADHILEAARGEAGTGLATPPRTLARLLDAAERAKIDLSRQPFVRVVEEALFKRRHLDLELARRTFEELIEGHLRNTMTRVDRALEEARLEAEQIDRVVLVGGSTRIPRIREVLGERFSCPVEHAVDPALCVGLGAAVQGAVLGGEVFDHILVDVTAHSLGIKTLDTGEDDPVHMAFHGPDRFATIIRRNTQIPAIHSELFSTLVDDQERVHVEVFQGESPRCSENTLIGDFLFDLRPAPARSKVVVELGYDLDGIVRVVVDQRGFDNRTEVTLDTRRREVTTAPYAAAYNPAAGDPAGDNPAAGDPAAGDPAAGDPAVDNYMVRKARSLARQLPEGELRVHLESAARAYRTVLDTGADAEEVDRLEDELLEALDAVEESLAGAAEAAAPVTGETR